MSPFEEGPGKTRSTHGPNKPANKIGIVEILLAVLIVYLLFQVIRFNQHTVRVHGDEPPTLALQ